MSERDCFSPREKAAMLLSPETMTGLTKPKIIISDWLVKCPTILNFAWTYKKFGWTHFIRKVYSIANIILVTYKLTRVIYMNKYLLVKVLF